MPRGFNNSLPGPADFARAHAGSLCLSRIGEKEDLCAVYMGRGPAVSSTVNLAPLVTPYYAIGNPSLRAIQLETLAPKQLQFARGAARVSADPSVRGNHAVAWNIDRYRIIVQCIADGSCAVCGLQGRAQCLITDQRATRHTLQFV